MWISSLMDGSPSGEACHDHILGKHHANGSEQRLHCSGRDVFRYSAGQYSEKGSTVSVQNPTQKCFSVLECKVAFPWCLWGLCQWHRHCSHCYQFILMGVSLLSNVLQEKKKKNKITVQKERNGKEIIMFEGQALDKYSQVRWMIKQIKHCCSVLCVWCTLAIDTLILQISLGIDTLPF